MRRAAVAVVAAIFIMLAAPAAQGLPDLGPVSPRPTVAEPIHSSRDGQVHLVVCGAFETIHARSIIRGIVTRLGDVTMKHRHKCFNPRRFKMSDRTVDIVVGGTNGYWGLTYPGRLGCMIHLDPTQGTEAFVVQHEFLHCLGMTHHVEPGGAMSIPTPSMLPISADEWAQLHAIYG